MAQAPGCGSSRALGCEGFEGELGLTPQHAKVGQKDFADDLGCFSVQGTCGTEQGSPPAIRKAPVGNTCLTMCAKCLWDRWTR